jgi:hypothetical protein
MSSLVELAAIFPNSGFLLDTDTQQENVCAWAQRISLPCAHPLLVLSDLHSFPLFEVDFSAPRVKRNKAKGPLLLHSWLIDLIDLPFVFIRPEVRLEQEFS